MPDYPVTVFFTREDTSKEITAQSLRMSGEQKLKEGDEINWQCETHNTVWLLFLHQSSPGVQMPRGGFCRHQGQRSGRLCGRGSWAWRRRDPGVFGGNRRLQGAYAVLLPKRQMRQGAPCQLRHQAKPQKLLNAYSDKAELAAMLQLPGEAELAVRTTAGRLLLVHSTQISEKQTRDSAGVGVVTLKKTSVWRA